MRWHNRASLSLTWIVCWSGDVADDCEMVMLVDDVASQPGSVTSSRVKKERGTRKACLCA